MLEYKIKLAVYWTYEKEFERQKAVFTKTFKTPYHKGGTLNDILLINKALIAFAMDEPEAVIYEVDVLELNKTEGAENND